MLKPVGVVAIVSIVVVRLAYGRAPRPELSTTIEIAAPPARVWAVLMDTADYPAWNPDMRLTGSLVPGATIENIEGHGAEQMVFWPTVVTVHPERELRWRGHYKLAGLFDAEHYFLLRPHGTGTVLVQGEKFAGVALWFYDVRQLLPSFARLNQGLKSRAERS